MNPAWFAGRLKELREAKGWNQHELADAAGLSFGAIQNLEQGRTHPTWDSVLALCVALGVDANAFTVEPSSRPPKGRGRPRKTPDEPEAPPEPPKGKRGKK